MAYCAANCAARVGYKTTTDGGLIASVGVHDGAYVDGSEFNLSGEYCEQILQSMMGERVLLQ